jgi:transcriptional/translational regulatory protein YebC/TACO1
MDDLMMIALEAFAEDFTADNEWYEVVTTPENFSQVRLRLEEEGIVMENAEVTMIPLNYVELTSREDIMKFEKILALLEDDDDVQDVYHNAVS